MSRVRSSVLTFLAVGIVVVVTAVGPRAAYAAGWTSPYLISAHNYLDPDWSEAGLSVAVDGAGNLHAAVAGVTYHDDGIWYVTNASGTRTMTRATRPVAFTRGPAPHDFAPTIAVDSDGSAWIAFERYLCTNCG